MGLSALSPELLRTAIPDITEISLLNKGGFKVVYKAKIKGKWEALKLIKIPSFPNRQSEEQEIIQREMRSRIFREIGILETINIPELVKLGSINKMEKVIDNREIIIYSEELISGSDLWQIIKSNNKKPGEKEICILFITLLKAIKTLWSKGYIHRDIKPANVMKTADPKRPFILMVLGIAFSIQDTALTFNAADRLPPATFRYIDPEMLNPSFRDSIDFRSDLYTAAMTVYEYASFSHPLARNSDDLVTTFSRALKQPPKKLSEQRKDLSPVLCTFVDQMLKKKRALRPANLDTVLSKLEDLL